MSSRLLRPLTAICANEKDANGIYYLHIQSGRLSAIFNLSALAGETGPLNEKNIILSNLRRMGMQIKIAGMGN